ncbi:MAG TPA: hypothetical protein VEI73_04680 [Candidatus Acidoferrum sp.]|nr:hypothetical protein [Candidatus Acidoferrum sp.]
MDPVIYLDTQGLNENPTPSPTAAEIASLSTKLSEAREQLSTSIGNARVESYSKFCELSTELVGLTKGLEKLTAEFEKAKWKMKFSAGMLAVVLAIGGILGFRYGYGDFYRDVRDTVTKKLEGEIQRGVIPADRSFYDDLVAGNALDATGQYSHATARLMECFKEGHYSDSAVLLPLLDAIYKSGDWETAKTVFDVLKKENVQPGGVGNHAVQAYLGAIQVQAAGFHPEWLQSGLALLEKAQLMTPPGDTATLSLIHTNYWVYDIQRQDWKGANAELSALKELDVPVDAWETTRRWRFFVQYFSQSKNLEYEPRIRMMWSQLQQKASDE